MRRVVAPVIALGAAIGAVALLRSRSTAARERADLYFEDGSMLSLEQDAPELDAIVVAARRIAGGAA